MKNNYKKISHVEAKKIIDSEESVIILDVREQDEINEGYIEGAVFIPKGDISEKAQKVIPDKNKKILVYCRSGKRSRKACEKLVEMGYKNVYDFGGIMDWPFEIVM